MGTWQSATEACSSARSQRSRGPGFFVVENFQQVSVAESPLRISMPAPPYPAAGHISSGGMRQVTRRSTPAGNAGAAE